MVPPSRKFLSAFPDPSRIRELTDIRHRMVFSGRFVIMPAERRPASADFIHFFI
jgi:hypothetical protein